MARRTSSYPVWTAIVVAIIAMAARASPLAAEDTGYEQALNARLAGIESMHARFRQFTLDRNRKFTRQQSGELWVEKPDRFRIVTGAPYVQVLVSDGRTFWSYDADLEQVIISDLEKDIREVPILLLGGEARAITGQYRVDYFDDGERDHFVLEPRTANSLFASLTIEFDGEEPAAISIRDNLGQQTRMEFIEPGLNVDPKAGTFRFEPPEDVDVIDDRKSPG